MDAIDPHHSWAEHVETEHRHLCKAIHDLRRAFDAPAEPATIPTLAAAVLPKLAAYRDEMREHFALEEEGGYMEEAVARVPSLSHSADKLIAEHKPLMTALERLIERLQKPSLSAREWSECRTDFAKFAEQAASHESNENWLLHEGFNLADE